MGQLIRERKKMKSKSFDLGNLKGKYAVPKFTYVPLEAFDMINELRIWFEICFAVGLTLMGSVILNLVGLISLRASFL